MKDLLTISDEDLERKMKLYKHVHRFEEGLFNVIPCHPRNQACTWDPKKEGEARKDIEAFDMVPTFHGYGHPMFFKPSLAEALAQIPKSPELCAFEIKHFDHLKDPGFHIAQTILYRFKDPLQRLGKSFI